MDSEMHPFEDTGYKNFGNLKATRGCLTHDLVMALLQWHKVSKLGEDEFHRPPVLALHFWYVHFRLKVRDLAIS